VRDRLVAALSIGTLFLVVTRLDGLSLRIDALSSSR
jgi:hypothetical protein